MLLASRLNGRGLTSASRTMPATKSSAMPAVRHARGSCMVIGLPGSRPIVSAKATPEVEQDSRTFRRTVADPAFWKKHRNVSRFSRHMFTMPGSRIIQGLAAPLAWLLTVSTALCIYETYFEAGQLPEYMPSLLMGNAQPQMLTSFAVSLLLVFRTNQSYDRWWEARKIWGGILNRVRDVTTQCVVFFPEEEHELRQACGRWTIAFARSLHAHLQEGVDVRNTLRNVLSPVELDMLCGSQHRVVKSLSVLAEIVKQAPMNPIQMQMMQLNVQFFYDALGMCERIYRTPLPLTYTRHTSRFLTLWLTTLPFTEWTTFGWATIPITLMIGMLLLGIDEIGVQIEEPFGVLPLDAICSRAELDARQIMNEQVLAKDYVQDMRDASSQYDKEEWERASANVAALLAARN